MKPTKDNLITLNGLFIVCLIIANVVTAKVINTGFSLGATPVLIPGAAITYALTFLCTDIIGELWGKEEANKAVWRGFLAQFVALLMISITELLPAHDSEVQAAYTRLLGQTPIFVIGSLAGYLCAQKWDVWIFHKIRDHFYGDPRRRWIWNNLSTMTSQIIDTAIYIVIAFGIGMGWLWMEDGIILTLGMILGQYFLKFGLAILDTPFFYLLTRKTKSQQHNNSTSNVLRN